MGYYIVSAILATSILATLALGLVDRDPDVYCQQCWGNRNQKDYYENPLDCTTYYHCFKNGSKIEGILRHCAGGLRFDEHILACVPMVYPPGSTNQCFDDCSNSTTMMEGFWVKPSECGIFYQCTNYYSRKMCCPPNHRFNETSNDCYFDKTCNAHNDECNQTGLVIPMPSPRIIDAETCYDVQYEVTRKVHADPSRYWVVLDIATTDTAEMIKNVSMPCPLGTHFELATCKCSAHVDATVGPSFEDCFLELQAKNGKIVDTSYMKLWVDNAGEPVVTTDSGSNFLCPGNALIEIPGMQGMSLGAEVTTSFWINPTCSGATTPGVIMSNIGENIVGGPVDPSVLVTFIGNDNAVELQLRTVKETITAVAPVACANWQHVAFVYDGMSVKTYVDAILKNTVHATQPEKQIIFWMAHCPLNVCADPSGGGFTGWLTLVRFCREAFSAGEIANLM